MPFVRIDIVKAKSREYKRTLLDCVHEGLVEAFGIDDDDRYQRICEIDGEDFERPPEKTDGYTLIELTIFPGRTAAQKEHAIRSITSGISESLGVSPKDIAIVMHEPPLENWGFAGRQKKGQ